MNRFGRLDGKHKLAMIAGIVVWGISIYFSQLGFATDNARAAWLGWILGCVVTVVELVFNSPTNKLSMTLIFAGILCYGYGIWTNVTGFWDFNNPGVPFVALSQASIKTWFVGVLIEVLPEPLFMWGLGVDLGGDLIDNITGLFSGRLGYAGQGNQDRGQSQQFSAPRQEQSRKPEYRPSSPMLGQNQKHNNQQKNPQKPMPAVSQRPLYTEPTYHPVGMDAQERKKPTNYQGE